jgi:membrane carboxypeptidase/penicillin-binding protein
VRLPLYDVHWAPAVVLEKVLLKGGVESIRVGLRDGRVLPLSTHGSETRRLLKINDVIYVRVFESRPAPNSRQQTGTRVELRSRPEVQAAAVVLENRTGRVLAMVGGFSFPLSQLNRATQSRRQPGSSFKPVVYLAALGSGLQPNTMISDGPITLPPIGYNPNSRSYSYDPKDWWSPKNYDSGSSGSMTLRRGLEQSKNLVTAHLLEGGIAASPAESLDRVCQVAKDAQLYEKCERYYPFVLGAQPVRPIDLAAFYATIPNEGLRPTPHIIESIQQSGKTIYRQSHRLTSIGAVDRAAAFQLRSILQGVLARGTARSIGAHAPYVGGKTGTSDEENDAWFVGFSNDVTIAVWVGYDNARGKRTLGGGQTGGKIAVPIFEPIMQAAWQFHAPKTVLRGPSPEASRMLVAMPIDLYSGARIGSRRRQDERLYGDRDFGEQPYGEQNPGSRAFTEYFRLDANGRMVDTQHRMISRSHVSHSHTYDVGNANPWNDRSAFDDNPFSRLFGFPAPQQPPPDPRYRGNAPPGYIGPRGLPQPAPRPDPNYQWGRQQQHRIY